MVPGVAELVLYVCEAYPVVAAMLPGMSCLPDIYPGVATMVPGVAEFVLNVLEAYSAVATMAPGVSC